LYVDDFIDQRDHWQPFEVIFLVEVCASVFLVGASQMNKNGFSTKLSKHKQEGSLLCYFTLSVAESKSLERARLIF